MNSDWDRIREAYEYEEFIENDGDDQEDPLSTSSNSGCSVVVLLLVTTVLGSIWG